VSIWRRSTLPLLPLPPVTLPLRGLLPPCHELQLASLASLFSAPTLALSPLGPVETVMTPVVESARVISEDETIDMMIVRMTMATRVGSRSRRTTARPEGLKSVC